MCHDLGCYAKIIGRNRLAGVLIMGCCNFVGGYGKCVVLVTKNRFLAHAIYGQPVRHYLNTPSPTIHHRLLHLFLILRIDSITVHDCALKINCALLLTRAGDRFANHALTGRLCDLLVCLTLLVGKGGQKLFVSLI